jgi:ssDNA-binding Zn-finger/Zn-ribbon topoisomerase 1
MKIDNRNIKPRSSHKRCLICGERMKWRISENGDRYVVCPSLANCHYAAEIEDGKIHYWRVRIKDETWSTVPEGCLLVLQWEWEKV